MNRPRLFYVNKRHPLYSRLVLAFLGNKANNHFLEDSSRKPLSCAIRVGLGEGSYIYSPFLRRFGVSRALTASSKAAALTTAPVLDDYSSFSVCSWVYNQCNIGENQDQYSILGSGNTQTYMSFRGGTNQVGILTSYGIRGVSNIPGGIIGLNHWAINVSKVDAATIKVDTYKNGVNVGNVNTASLFSVNPTVCKNLSYATIGVYVGPGELYDTMIFNGNLSDQEIANFANPANIYLNGLIQKESPVLYFDMGTSAPVLSGIQIDESIRWSWI